MKNIKRFFSAILIGALLMQSSTMHSFSVQSLLPKKLSFEGLSKEKIKERISSWLGKLTPIFKVVNAETRDEMLKKQINELDEQLQNTQEIVNNPSKARSLIPKIIGVLVLASVVLGGGGAFAYHKLTGEIPYDDTLVVVEEDTKVNTYESVEERDLLRTRGLQANYARVINVVPEGEITIKILSGSKRDKEETFSSIAKLIEEYPERVIKLKQEPFKYKPIYRD